MSQEQQRKALGKLRKDETNVLITASTGEEGLDIPEVDHVVFYELFQARYAAYSAGAEQEDV
jgi:ERCC4-related helicase